MSDLACPDLIVHADWSKDAGKRWLAKAFLQPDGAYLALPPEQAPELKGLLIGLQQEAGSRG